MNLELDEDQQEILGALAKLLERHAGPARAAFLARESGYDFELDQALAEAGFDRAMDPERLTGALEAALIVEAVARAAGVSGLAAAALVAPATTGRSLEGPIALGSGRRDAPLRFALQARHLLWLEGDEARLTRLEPGDVEPVDSNFGFPLGRVAPRAFEASESLGAGSGERMQSWWRLALALETVGAMSAALEQTVAYLKLRKQFGRTIASFQAVQHRLADCAVRVEGSRWLAYEAADKQAPTEASACAAAHAIESARLISRETHQLSGAIGFTHDHELHVWSMRLHALGAEQGGVAGHRRALARSRWGARPEVGA